MNILPAQEYNFDGLVGPTHNYAGLSHGNIASVNNSSLASNPKSAALQGLLKMKQLMDLGVPQAVLPPQPRPNLELLKNLGFSGTTEKILKQAYNTEPRLFAASYSASGMWTANAATVTSSMDSADHKLHLTPANLAVNLHRTIEAKYNYNILNQIFSNSKYFTVHSALFNSPALGDEGAANHTRFCNNYDNPGINLFVYGQEYYNKSENKPRKFPARQSLEASRAIARKHELFHNTFFLQQCPMAIDQGVFHNDVCAVGNKNILLCYEQAYVDQKNSLVDLSEICKRNNIDLNIHQISTQELSFIDMVNSYLFNSQLISLDVTNRNKKMALIAPVECQEIPTANMAINNILSTQPIIAKVIYVDCRESMRNGGGPACLRLRVVLNSEEVAAIKRTANIILTDQLYNQLTQWVNQYYRDRLELQDLLDPCLISESNQALEALGKILKLNILNY